MTTSLTDTPPAKPIFDIELIKARQKATWESGDFGEVAKFIIVEADRFMAGINLKPGAKVLDAACGTGNLALLAAQRGCITCGLDIASNLIAQARERAWQTSLAIEFAEGDAEAMPYPNESFDAVVSMYGVMFAPRPERVVSELRRVTRPGGLIALANWTPGGFIGKMFAIFARHLPPPAGFPSPLLWGNEEVVRARFEDVSAEIKIIRRMARMRFPFDAAGTVKFFRRYYGPTHSAFNALTPAAQEALMNELIELHIEHNISGTPNETETPSEYLDIQVRIKSN